MTETTDSAGTAWPSMVEAPIEFCIWHAEQDGEGGVAKNATRELAALRQRLSDAERETQSAHNKLHWREKTIADLRDELSDAEQREAGMLARVLAEFERRTKAVPVGHEIPSRGASTYNWRRCHLDELREIAAALPLDGLAGAPATPAPDMVLDPRMYRTPAPATPASQQGEK